MRNLRNLENVYYNLTFVVNIVFSQTPPAWSGKTDTVKLRERIGWRIHNTVPNLWHCRLPNLEFKKRNENEFQNQQIAKQKC